MLLALRLYNLLKKCNRKVVSTSSANPLSTEISSCGFHLEIFAKLLLQFYMPNAVLGQYKDAVK